MTGFLIFIHSQTPAKTAPVYAGGQVCCQTLFFCTRNFVIIQYVGINAYI